MAAAIITSDTHPKEIAISFDLGEHRVRLGGCVKGAGMISPSMATMLCFITTDANIPSECLRKAVLECVEESFNRITIDGDMSTNDTVLVLANGASGMPPIRRNGKRCKQFRRALRWLMLELAKAVVRDGERVTKFVTVQVIGARTYLDAKKVAEAVCKSALVKSSWNGGDPNWGRIIHAVGYSRARIREELVDIHIGGKAACLGGLQADTPMDELRAIVAEPEFEIVINLNQGERRLHDVFQRPLAGIHRLQPLRIRLLETGAQGRVGVKSNRFDTGGFLLHFPWHASEAIRAIRGCDPETRQAV